MVRFRSFKQLTQRRRSLLAILLASALLTGAGALAALGASGRADAAGNAQQATPTSVQLDFPQATSTLAPAEAPTATRTATPATNNFVEALNDDTNVRANASLDAERLGLIYTGTQYRVLGQRADWYQIVFPDAPSGTAWVYSGVVTLTGDPASIPEVQAADIPTVDPAFLAAQETAAFVRETPGGLATLTAAVAVTPTGVFTPGAEATLDPSAIPPTFTEPAQTVTPIIIPRGAPATPSSRAGVPPIVPILALAALGLMGLLVGLLRRL